jgi:glycosyltransferase involved in cell wall biosynthesis
MCIAKLLNRPCLVSLGGWELSNLPHINYGAQRITIHRWLIRHVLRHANGVTAGSAYQLNLAHQHGVSPHKLHFASLGVDILHFRPARQPLSLTQPTLIQVASLLPVKNQAVLLQTLHLVKRAIPHIHVHLVGTGPLENELKLLAQQLNITENITWHQHVAHLELPARYHQAHLYIQSSWHESQGMAVLEAMACGLPVIGTPVGIMPEVACLPPTFIATQLAAQIIAIFTNPDFYQTASQKARHVVTSNFNLVAATRTFETLYQSLNRT